MFFDVADSTINVNVDRRRAVTVPPSLAKIWLQEDSDALLCRTLTFGMGYLDQMDQRILELLSILEAVRSPAPAPTLNFLQEFECPGPICMGGFEGDVWRPDQRVGVSCLRMPARLQIDGRLFMRDATGIRHQERNARYDHVGKHECGHRA